MAGSTNFLQWNPTQNNQETDPQYQADSQRTGGAPVGTPFPSKTANKVLYQTSTGVTALMKMMANKGYVCTDTNIGTLTSVLSAIQTGADMKSLLTVVGFSPSAHFDASTSSGFQITLSGNANSCTIGGWSPGQVITFVVIQDAAGGRSINIPGVSNWQGADWTAPNATSIFQIVGRADGNLYSCNQELLTFTPVQQNGGAGQLSNKVFVGWSGTRLKAQVDATDLGNIVFDTQLTPVSSTASGAAASIAAFKALFTGSLVGNGFFKIGTNGGSQVIIQWGIAGPVPQHGSGLNVSFPLAFPTTCYNVIVCDTFSSGNSRIMSVQGITNSGFNAQADGSGNSVRWFAIGV